ncbi:hypothetical protein [Pseudomonas lini]
MNKALSKLAICLAFLSSSVYAGEDLSSKYWSLGWSKKATVVSKESDHYYVRVIPADDGMQLAYIVSGEGACPEGESSFKVQGEVNGKSLSFAGMCSDEYYKELVPATEAEQLILRHEFLTKKSVVVKVGKLPKRTFTTDKFRTVAESAGLGVEE